MWWVIVITIVLWLMAVWFTRPKPQRQIISLLIDLIEVDRDWHRDTYYWWHPSGVGIWVKNKDYGLAIKLDLATKPSPAVLGPGNIDEARTKGYLEISKNERTLIWKAIQKNTSKVTTGNDEESMLRLAHRITEMYDAKP